MPQFFFDYFDGKRLHEAEDGLELPDVEAAYLEAFQAATDMWGEALRGRRNPTLDCFRIRDRAGLMVLELPFTEVVESSRGGRREPPPRGRIRAANAVELATRRVLHGRKIVADQHKRVERLKGQGRYAAEAERSLSLFTQCLGIFEDQLKTLQAAQEYVRNDSRRPVHHLTP